MRKGSSVEGSERRTGTARQRAGVLLAALVLLIAIVPALAFAEDPAPSNELPPSAFVDPGEGDPLKDQLTDPQAAEELPHEDLGREEAVELTEAVFEPELEAPAGPFDEPQAEKFLSDYVAVTDAGDQSSAPGVAVAGGEGQASGTGESTVEEPQAPNGEPALLESTLPLRVEGSDGSKEAVDLGLENTEGQWQPVTPLVEVEIPQELGEGIELPESGVKIELVEGPEERSPSIVNGSVASYPNVASDTDLSVAPTPTGVETMTTIRSPESPLSETFRLSLPADATLRERAGGAEVIQGDETVLEVLPPSALDANGDPVPVSLSVSGNSLTLEVSPEPSTTFPLMVDPIYESYAWWGNSSQAGKADWHSWTLNGNLAPTAQDPLGGAVNALFVYANPAFYGGGTNAGWNYYVPRLQEEEAKGHSVTSYIASMTLQNVGFATSEGGLYPALYAGIWDKAEGNWAGKDPNRAIYGYAGNAAAFWGKTLIFTNGEPGHRDEHAQTGTGISMGVPENSSLEVPREAYVGNATLEVADGTKPTVSKTTPVSSWLNNQIGPPISVYAGDTGLGVKDVKFELAGYPTATVTNPCVGTAANPCPAEWTATLQGNEYNPAALPQGENWVSVRSEDVVGNTSAEPLNNTYGVFLKVDHTPPTVSLSGTATEQAKLGTNLPEYTLKYTAADGIDGTATAQSPFGSLGSGNGQLSGPRGIVADGKGHVWVVDHDNNRVEEFTEEGAYLGQFGSKGSGPGQFNEPFGIALTEAGNLWVTDTGNGRLEEFDQSGKFLQQFGTKGTTSSGTTLVEPLRVAAAPGGMLWVSDGNGNRVAEFRESVGGSEERWVRDVTGTAEKHPPAKAEFAQPIGVALDPTGNTLYVVDHNKQRIQKFDTTTGEFLGQFGAYGSGPGQLNEPSDVAVAPSGDLLVTDQENNRVEEFQPGGHFVRQFGTKGSGNANLSAPRGISFGAANTVFIVDKANNRIAKWTNADSDPQSGAAKGEIKVDGQKVDEYAPGCTTKDCTLSREWMLKANQFTGGKHTIEVIATDAVGISTSKTLEVEVHPDKVAPNVVLTGTMTQQGSLGTSRPRYKIKVASSDGALGEFPNPAGLIAAYSFDEGSGTVAHDLFGTHNATIEGAKWMPSRYGSSLEFLPNQHSVLKVASSGDLRLRKLTLEAQVRPNEARAVAPIISKTSAESYGYALDAGGELPGKPEGLITNKKSVASYTFYNSVLPTNAWSNLALTDDGSNLRLYDNGTLVDTRPAVNVEAGPGELRIGGAETFGPAEYLAGKLDELRIYNRALSGAEVAADQSAPNTPPRQSGIVGTEISVDGKTVDSSSAGCTAENCVVPREWTLESSAYSAGKHTVVAKATDGFGNTTTKTLSIEVQKDTTKPTLNVSGELFSAPEGWVEQESYGFNASASDGGYGVTSLLFKIDGKEVASNNTSCPDGGCERSLSKQVNMAAYAGGAHAAEVIATDGAGNTTTKKWTINVDPQGKISSVEATDTLEAAEDTAEELQPVASTAEALEPQEIEAGDNPGLKESAGVIESTGVTTSTKLNPASETVTFEGTEGPIQVTPALEGSATAPEIASGVAAVTPSVGPGVDTVVRPEYNGGELFTIIREPTSPERYPWHVQLYAGQTMHQVNEQQIEVDWENGHSAYLITAEPARDATGKAVSSSLEIDGSESFVQIVAHHSGSFVYPIDAGQAYETGYSSVVVIDPPVEEEPEESLSSAELDDLLASNRHGRPLTKKQAKHLLKSMKKQFSVPAPAYNAEVDRPGNEPHYRTFSLESHDCEIDTCSAWETMIHEGTYARGIDWAEQWSTFRCDGEVGDWWSANIADEPVHSGVLSPTLVYKGSGEHITYWCHFKVEVYPLPEVYSMSETYALQDWVFPNGYQESHVRHWNTVIEN